jgi:death-on-curing protein
MNTRMLSAENVLCIHDHMIAQYGGLYGVRDEDLFLFLCDAPYQQFGGQDLYESVFDKAAKYLEGFARHQVFFDGNKRTAAAVALVFLHIHGITLNYPEEVFANFVLEIANTQNISVAQISAVLKNHCV